MKDADPFVGTQPNPVFTVNYQRFHFPAGQQARTRIQEIGEFGRSNIEGTKAAVEKRNPKRTLGILGNRGDLIVADSLFVIHMVIKILELPSIVTREPEMGADPKESTTVFENSIYLTLCDSVMAEVVPESKIVILRIQADT
jgi:hypothetical protein